MKIAIPVSQGKLCGHFGHCEAFAFAQVDDNSKKILNIEEKTPQEEISCKSASWVCEQGVNIVLAGGMGNRPMGIFEQNGVEVISGCPELPIKEVVEKFINNTLEKGQNSCSGEHHHCHGHHEGGSCHH